jgi:4-hydroxymandelate oxidase
MNLVNFDEFEQAAREILPKMIYDYYVGGADDEVTLRDNRAAFQHWKLRPRTLAGVGSRSLETSVLGTKLSLPVGIPPMALHMLAHPDGELGTARAASAAGVLNIVGTLASYSMEEIAEVSSGPRWFQLYWYKDRGMTENLIDRAKAAGYSALMLTTDAPVVGRRERDLRNRFAPPPGVVLKNFESATNRLMTRGEGSGLSAYVAAQVESNLTWKDLDWLITRAGMPVVLKGIMTAEDARLAVEHGAEAIVVSNHGARQLDTTLPSIDVLPEVMDAVTDKLEVLVDGGFRRGTDIFKALALGAKLVLIGRPVLWGLAVDGEAGVRHVFDMIRTDFDIIMALCGCASIGDIKREMVVRD